MQLCHIPETEKDFLQKWRQDLLRAKDRNLERIWKEKTRQDHRHLREIDCSLAIVGGTATAYSHDTESRGKSIHWPRIQLQSVFLVVGSITTTVNKDRGQANERSITLDVYGQDKIHTFACPNIKTLSSNLFNLNCPLKLTGESSIKVSTLRPRRPVSCICNRIIKFAVFKNTLMII